MGFDPSGWLTAWTAAGLLAVPYAGVRTREVAPADLPAAVRQAALASAPGAELTRAVRCADHRGPLCRLSGRDAKGREVVVEVDARGEALRVTTAMTEDDLSEGLRRIVRDHARSEPITRIRQVEDVRLARKEILFEGPDATGALQLRFVARFARDGR